MCLRIGRETVKLTPLEAAVATFLSLRRGSVTRDAICDAIWPEASIEDASNTLKVAIYRLRRKAGSPNFVVATRGAYALNPIVRVDLVEIEREIASWGSPANVDAKAEARLLELDRYLAHANISGLGAFEWFFPIERRVAEIRRTVQLALAQNAIRDGRFARAHALVSEQIERDPYDDEAHRVLIALLTAQGAQSDARRTYLHYQEFLAREMGLRPSFEFPSSAANGASIAT
jgi:DNA-binding SARP family transcriptional activator